MKRTPLTRSTPLRYRSKRAEAVYRLRRPLVAHLLAENPRCQYPACSRPSVDCHELLSRARGGSVLDPANIRCICRPHHDWITTHPAAAAATGWALSRKDAA
jgi:hypothetical protein